ncbi:hypothetical protein OSB04_016999 [Centaurea solstitialis]|uniref:GAG-pre-integrase domain-containing protein n=1 Tax=Centaurea solstitialis TaxID=347529 RepID=A0AA38T3R4_9ASTR|nr:hypothetical protein OSB04_016999 [Centaurea solstitialis]
MNQHALAQAVAFCGYQTCRVIYRLSCSLCNQSRLLEIGSGLSVETGDEELQSRGSFLNHNLFSIGKFCDKDLEVNFNKRQCAVRTEWGRELLVGTRKTNLYTIKLRHMLAKKSQCLITKKSSHQSLLWHRRLSHLNYRYLDRLVKERLVSGIPMIKFEPDQMCSGCAQGK